MFDPVHLRSFVTVAHELSFTRAAERLELRQSTVSQHVRKLEAAAGRPLLVRDTHSVALTPDGEAMIGFAGAILDTTRRALAHFDGAQVFGRLRVGLSEDLVLARLTSVLAAFRRRYPLVDLELTVGMSEQMEQLIDHGELDLLFAKRSPGRLGGTPLGGTPLGGTPLWRDRFVWVAGPEPPVLGPDDVVPLVSYPPPSLSRAAAIAALERRGRPWRMACTSDSLNGLRAAALAGLGVLPHAATLVPAGLVPVPTRAGLPELDRVDIVLTGGRRGLHGPAAALADTITDSVDQLRP